MDKRKQVWREVLGDKEESHIEEIYISHFTQKEKTFACSETYIYYCPETSWEHLTSLLYEKDEMTAVEHARPFLPPRGKYIYIYICMEGLNCFIPKEKGQAWARGILTLHGIRLQLCCSHVTFFYQLSYSDIMSPFAWFCAS